MLRCKFVLPGFMEPIALSGSPGSPYTRKMLALLRFRRIPYRFLRRGIGQPRDMPQANVDLMPTFYLMNEHGELEAVVDSTPIIRRLEASHGGRSVIPSDPVVGFLDLLLEDYADEWLTKAMFHFRWWREEDIAHAAGVLPLFSNPTMPSDQLAGFSQMVRDRQVGRLYVVGSNETTAEIIEASYARFLTLLDAHLQTVPFTFGRRPASADFGMFGQLTQLANFDITPTHMTRETAPRILAWVAIMEDLCGLEPEESDWLTATEVGDTLRTLLSEVGRVYVPVLLANGQAINQGAEDFETEVDGAPWRQRTFPYQAKCLQWLRQAYARMDGDDRERLDSVLAGTGCERLFE